MTVVIKYKKSLIMRQIVVRFLFSTMDKYPALLAKWRDDVRLGEKLGEGLVSVVYTGMFEKEKKKSILIFIVCNNKNIPDTSSMYNSCAKDFNFT